MATYGMLINTKKCVGCYACRVACQMKNELTKDKSYLHFEELETGIYPSVYVEQVPIQCMHCVDAPCQSVCPTGATFTTDTGVVLVEEGKCIGCKYCMVACPYGVRTQLHSGVVEKCRFCWENDGPDHPSCVSTCVSGARIFGDIDDPESEISKAIAKNNALPIAGNLTKSKIFYVR